MLHQTQKMFRMVMNAMAHPGIIERANEQIVSLGIHEGAVLLTTLLDKEVTFHGMNLTEEEIIQICERYRTSYVTISEADFILLMATRSVDDYDVLNAAKIGTLIDPQKSATLIILACDFQNSVPYIVSGPGIMGQQQRQIPQILEALLPIRQKLNQEFPLGVDIILSDIHNNMMCFPRTTNMTKELI